MNTPTRSFHVAGSLSAGLLMLAVLLSGCASGQKKNDAFFTSGNKEADQRAEQKMAKAKELKGTDSSSSSSSKTKTAAGEKVPDKTTLYQRLGGQDGIHAIVEDFIPRALNDPRVNWDRKGVTRGGFSFHRNQSVQWDASPANVAKLKLHMEQFLALATGGPTKYEGKEMGQAHHGLHITDAEFDAAIGDLKASLDKLKVRDAEQKELLAIVESTRQQVAEER